MVSVNVKEQVVVLLTSGGIIVGYFSSRRSRWPVDFEKYQPTQPMKC